MTENHIIKHRILIWELTGFFLITVAGSLLHFVYDWLGQWQPSAIIAAVNESTWEHLKLAFWPALTFAFIQSGNIRRCSNNFIIAKTISFYIMPLSIILLFYFYTWVLGRNYLILDILIFVLGIGIGQCVSYRLLSSRKLPRLATILSAIFFFALLLAFLLFTYFPPRMFLFKNPITGGYGIP